jgi:hypothetical protein
LLIAGFVKLSHANRSVHRKLHADCRSLFFPNFCDFNFSRK